MKFTALLTTTLLSFGIFNTIVRGELPTPSPTPLKVGTDTRPGELKLTRLGPTSTSLNEELATAELEPRLKQFKLNLRFLRGTYTRPKFGELTGHQYMWDYFPEARVIVKFYETPPGYYSSTSAEERKQQLIKETEIIIARNNFKIAAHKDIIVGSELARDYEVTSGAVKVRMLIFVHRGVWYSLMAEAKTAGSGPIIDKLFNSFTFVPDGS